MRRFGLIGRTLKHSFSKDYFARKFADEGIRDCRYDLFELAGIDELPGLITREGPEGLNVTIPYKEAVLPYLDERDDIVKEIGACNCIRLRDGKLQGFNTDAPAFARSLRQKLQPHHRCALILGSGGASKAVQYALRELGIDYVVVSRRKQEGELGYEDVGNDALEGHQILINTTPLGMYPNVDQDPPISYEYLSPQHLLFDLVYNPERTRFLQKGAERGAAVMNGHEMLVYQAEESWRIWNE